MVHGILGWDSSLRVQSNVCWGQGLARGSHEELLIQRCRPANRAHYATEAVVGCGCSRSWRGKWGGHDVTQTLWRRNRHAPRRADGLSRAAPQEQPQLVPDGWHDRAAKFNILAWECIGAQVILPPAHFHHVEQSASARVCQQEWSNQSCWLILSRRNPPGQGCRLRKPSSLDESRQLRRQAPVYQWRARTLVPLEPCLRCQRQPDLQYPTQEESRQLDPWLGAKRRWHLRWEPFLRTGFLLWWSELTWKPEGSHSQRGLTEYARAAISWFHLAHYFPPAPVQARYPGPVIYTCALSTQTEHLSPHVPAWSRPRPQRHAQRRDPMCGWRYRSPQSSLCPQLRGRIRGGVGKRRCWRWRCECFCCSVAIEYSWLLAQRLNRWTGLRI